MIKCVCLVEETENQILLVQVRNREKYYFPGGKIDEGETQLEADTKGSKRGTTIRVSTRGFHIYWNGHRRCIPANEHANRTKWI